MQPGLDLNVMLASFHDELEKIAESSSTSDWTDKLFKKKPVYKKVLDDDDEPSTEPKKRPAEPEKQVNPGRQGSNEPMAYNSLQLSKARKGKWGLDAKDAHQAGAPKPSNIGAGMGVPGIGKERASSAPAPKSMIQRMQDYSKKQLDTSSGKLGANWRNNPTNGTPNQRAMFDAPDKSSVVTLKHLPEKGKTDTVSLPKQGK